ncbi:hypothetical protein ACJD0Z_01740 [Flavobacteriaceae bacterium M23B6Z8]
MKKKNLSKLTLSKIRVSKLMYDHEKGGQFYGSRGSCLTFEETCFCNFNIQAGEELPVGNLCYGELF